MPLRTIRAKVEKAAQRLESLMRSARRARADCVLVVYDRSEAKLYYEGDSGVPKVTR